MSLIPLSAQGYGKWVSLIPYGKWVSLILRKVGVFNPLIPELEGEAEPAGVIGVLVDLGLSDLVSV